MFPHGALEKLEYSKMSWLMYVLPARYMCGALHCNKGVRLWEYVCVRARVCMCERIKSGRTSAFEMRQRDLR